MFNPQFNDGLESELRLKVAERVTTHRDRFARILYNRYLEILPTIITYVDLSDKKLAVDWLKVEVALRGGYDCIIGETRSGAIRLLGISTNKLTVSDPANFVISDPLNGRDIQWLVSEEHRLPIMKEITEIDDCQTGNFIVLRNKILNYTSDYEIVKHYAMELAEIVCSRYSLKMQSKITTFIIGEPNDQTAEQIVESLYNGAPFVNITGAFDPDEHIQTFDGSNISTLMTELKREYSNALNELNSMIGLSGLGVDKESGVTESESNSGEAYQTANGNVNIESRKNGLDKLNKRYGAKVYPVMNDKMVTKLTILNEKLGGEQQNGSNNNLPNGYPTNGTPETGEE
ncbi:capsid and scaffold protein [Enterococcus phage vB_EfaP_Efmus1]|uniref:Capsid and scaffold protein n=2 Tax=Copernicusvirus Efmus1 TaxID=2844145 RepID=A0A4D6DT22_9CAUD|nr:upper collar connector [Enterococcus phage vB_EfaP_Efmus1]QBZ69517.1 capsid and scaffold protein [Enterococcus phage vB_EfaP_Efmus1]QBZ69570.1 capsid and scaffold protein [Enterococcus phage vB_EfaP_Efmus2]